MTNAAAQPEIGGSSRPQNCMRAGEARIVSSLTPKQQPKEAAKVRAPVVALPGSLQHLTEILGRDGSAEADALLAIIESVRAGCVDSLDEALGLKSRPGSRRWQTLAALEARDAHLRAAASTFDLAAPELARKLDRYASTAWPRDRASSTCPSRLEGKPEADFWRALRAWPRQVGERQLQKMLRTELGLFSSREPEDTGQNTTQEHDEKWPT